MFFDIVISNPPYDKNLDKTIYNYFMDIAFTISKISIFITPAKFLSNGGRHKNWNEKILSNNHLKVIKYFSNSFEVFPFVFIKGGVAITLYNNNKIYNKTECSILSNELEMIKEKIIPFTKHTNVSNIVFSRDFYKFNNSETIGTNAFIKFPELFNETDKLIIYGRQNNKRITKHISVNNVKYNEEIYRYKVFFAKANGGKTLGSICMPFIGKPNEICTDTYISIGSFDNEKETKNCMTYIKTKFFRGLLGIKKTTQLMSRETFSFIPLQDFTEKSDIDWTKSIKEIEQQLYKKYNFTKEDIEYIENNVKEIK